MDRTQWERLGAVCREKRPEAQRLKVEVQEQDPEGVVRGGMWPGCGHGHCEGQGHWAVTAPALLSRIKDGCRFFVPSPTEMWRLCFLPLTSGQVVADTPTHRKETDAVLAFRLRPGETGSSNFLTLGPPALGTQPPSCKEAPKAL